jgi:hypothetical protein
MRGGRAQTAGVHAEVLLSTLGVMTAQTLASESARPGTVWLS